MVSWITTLLLTTYLKSLEMKIISLMTILLIISLSSPESLTELSIFQLDFLTISMCNLSLLLTSISMIIFSNQESKKKKDLCMISGIIAFIFFMSNNLMMFFILFECSLIPLLTMIIGWGKQPERISAGTYIIFYTLISSFPLLCSMVYLEEEMGMFSMNNPLINNNYSFLMWSKEMSMILSMSLVVSFLMKVPILFLHSWLPKAHVEAPLEGSIILAGIMLKVGTFGVIRIISIFQSDSFQSIQTLVFCISILGSVSSIMMAVSSDDLKLSIALSSVSHMNFLVSSIFPLKEIIPFSSNCTMISHGLSSSILFFFVTIIYEMNNSRSMTIVKGTVSKIPQVAFFGLVFFSLSIAIPPSLPFIGELLSISIIWDFSNFLAPLICSFILINSFFAMTSFGMLAQSSKKKTLANCNMDNSFNLSSTCTFAIMLMAFFFPLSIA